MKFRVTMKDPDTLYDAVQDAVNDWINTIDDLTDDERQDLADTREGTVMDIARKWFKYGEYLTVEIDTEAGTAVVVEV